MAIDGAVTVRQLNMYVKSILSSDINLRGITVRGEISNYTRNARSGHAYFTLKDNDASVKCVMFSSYCNRVNFDVSDGMEVFVSGSVSLYERDGTYQFLVEKMSPVGIGAAYLAFLQLKEKLEKLGLFDAYKKKPLPKYPSTIGLITSKTGAAIKDFCSISASRYPGAEIILYPATVQGDGCRESVCAGIDYFNNRGVDVICITRGGGSYEDLSCFNDEAIAYAVYKSEIPVVSGVGHEIDFTIIDFVADVRAATPSNAAEIICPSIGEMKADLYAYSSRLKTALFEKVADEREKLKSITSRLNPSDYASEKTFELENIRKSIMNASEKHILKQEQVLINLSSKIEAMNPLSVLLRGYAIASVSGKTVGRAKDIREGDNIELRFTDGVIDCVAGKKNDL